MKWLLVVSFSLLSFVAAQYNDTEEELILPPLSLSSAHSWRGPVAEDGRIPGFDISGHTLRLPNTPDFLRLLPAQPLAHGAFFASQPIKSKEWVVEIGFRVHGKQTAGTASGGRGLAFWAHKAGNPTGITTPGDGKKGKAPPTFLPIPQDPSDPKVSFFGDASPFEGLGVIFDTAASLSVLPRSDRESWSLAGADSVGVVSGILDDGKGGHIETKGARPPEQDEAKYLEFSQGECEAAFRNAPGLVWARITHFDSKVRVDMDLTPHTSLSTAARVFSNHCFTIEGVALPSGYRLGMSALASGAAEPDAVDVYAFEVFDVVRNSEEDQYKKRASVEARAAESAPLAGTSSGEELFGGTGVAHELFSSQAKIIEAIDGLARRVEELSREVSKSSGTSMQGHLAQIERRLTELTGRGPQSPAGDSLSQGEGQSAGPSTQEREKQSTTYLANMVHQVAADVKQLAGRYDNSVSRMGGQLATIQTRMGETFSLLHKTSGSIEAQAAERLRNAQQGWSRFILIPVILLVAVALILALLRLLGATSMGRRSDDSNGLLGSLGSSGGMGRRGGKKLI